jgi:uncharacterized damage-inducible protein DinB
MNTSLKLQHKLQSILNGNAWYGDPVYTIIDSVTFEAAFEKADGASHSIAEILWHMLAWTEEVMNRLQGEHAAAPKRGDWPDAGMPDEDKWKQLISSFKLVNVNLVKLVGDFPEDKWSDTVNDSRDKYWGYDASYETLVDGLIQHHVYHAGQISLLNKIING